MITSNYQVDGDIYSYADKFFCDSHDDKPSNADARDGLINGAILEETDTGKTYIFDKKANQWTEKAAGGGGGGGGSTTLAGLTDVDISNPSNGQTLVYNSTSGKWENGDGGGGSQLLVNFVYDELSDSYPGDKTAGEVLASCQQYGFAIGICDGVTNHPFVITAADGPQGIELLLGSWSGIRFDEFESFDPDISQHKYYQSNEYLTGYSHST